jgi:N-acetylmuramoyl-L-alanine amidase
MVKFKVRNRLNKVDNLASAQIELLDATSHVVASAATDAHGVASIDVSKIAKGSYRCTIEAQNTFAGDVGPSLASSGTPPDRIYRSVTLSVNVNGPLISSATPSNPLDAAVSVSGNLVAVDVQPVWMKSAQSSSRGKHSISMIIVHHTACDLHAAVATFLSEKGPHYMIDTDGQIVKWVQDSRAAWHAGESRWHGEIGINSPSIGIEIVNKTGPYPQAQYTSLLSLIGSLTTAFSTINTWDIIGHSDIGTDTSGRLGRKSGDPGLLFEWQRLEAQGFGMLMGSNPPPTHIYSGFFDSVPGGSLRLGDNDKHRRFGGAVRHDITGDPVQELQEDLSAIGYSLGNSDGDFAAKCHSAVLTIQEHFFAGGRGKAPDGRVDLDTANLIKSVLGKLPTLRQPRQGDYEPAGSKLRTA